MGKQEKQNNNYERPVWTNGVRYIALVWLIIIIIFLAYLVRGSLTLLVISALTAYLMSPIVRILNRKLHIRRNAAIIIAYIMLIILAIVAISFIIPQITQTVRNFFALDWPQILTAIDEYLETLEREVDSVGIVIGGYNLDLSAPLEILRERLGTFRSQSINIETLIPDTAAAARQVFSFSTGVFGQIFAGMIMTITAFMASMYLCRDGHKLGGYIVSMFEGKYQPEIRVLIHRIRLVWDRYFAGELKLMAYIGLITFVVYSLLGIRWALLLGVIAAFFEVVPNIGPILAALPAILSALIFGSRWISLNNIVIALLVIGAAVLIQQTENMFLVPHVMGNALKLHPVIIIIGILVLSSRIGLLGAVFAAPLIALSKEILYFILKKVKQQDPYPELYE